MAVQIYDSSAGAFKDAPTPQIYDAGTQAFKDSSGLVYDSEASAWDERWGGKLWLYKDGNECKKITGGWERKAFNWASGATGGSYSISKNSDGMRFQDDYSGAAYSNAVYVCTLSDMDFSQYNKIFLKIRDYVGKISSSPNCYIAYYKNNTFDTLTQLGQYTYIGSTSDVTIQSVIPSEMKANNCRICLSAYYTSFTVEKIWLEK